jgi:hypothetical protein
MASDRGGWRELWCSVGRQWRRIAPPSAMRLAAEAISLGPPPMRDNCIQYHPRFANLIYR